MGKISSLVLDRNTLAYVVGVALGDGNLSNPNGRAIRLRITCDLKYPQLIQRIKNSISSLLPFNKVSFISRKDRCVDISCYSNQWEKLLGWRVGKGSKLIQNVSIPAWIKKGNKYKISCLQGLIETDGCVYLDRGYKAVMFTNSASNLARDVNDIMLSLGFFSRIYIVVKNKKNPVYKVRLATNVDKFLDIVKPNKS